MIGIYLSGEDKSMYFAKDHLGTVRTTMNETGEIENAMDYYPYGEEITGRSVNYGQLAKYKFTGKERDAETSYDYFGARYYDSQLGRWLQVDPLADKYPGWSPYNYCSNNPLTNIDPHGMSDSTATKKALIVPLPNVNIGPLPIPFPPDIETAKATGKVILDFIEEVEDVNNTIKVFTVAVISLLSSDEEKGKSIEEQTKAGAQDKKLSDSEIEALEEGGVDVHELKGNKSSGERDLYKDSKGNIKIKPKGGKGPGEETGYNIKNYLK